MSRRQPSRAPGRAVAVCAALLAASCAAPGPQPLRGAQDATSAEVVSARLTARPLPDGDADVRIDYRLTGPVVGPIRLEVLDFGPSVAGEVRVGEVGVDLAVERGRMRSATLAGLPAGDVVTVTYRVARAIAGSGPEVRLRLPVLVVDLPPASSVGDVFEGDVHVPAEWRVTEAFPSGLAPTGEGGAWRVELAVVPSLVTLRGRTDGGGGLGLTALLDVLAVAILLGFGLLGVRHLRRVSP